MSRPGAYSFPRWEDVPPVGHKLVVRFAYRDVEYELIAKDAAAPLYERLTWACRCGCNRAVVILKLPSSGARSVLHTHRCPNCIKKRKGLMFRFGGRFNPRRTTR
ncbi:MAG: hypothetical protein ACREDH_15685 [Methylocella sp.]